ncbi:TPA: hypothetical protein ONC18_002245 [Enterobacter kobei]|nr:hypothetical protein [Enterobacter kobei]
MVKQTVQYGGWLLSVVLNVIPCYAVTIGASSITFEGGTEVIDTYGSPLSANVSIETTSGQCDLKNHIKTTIRLFSSNTEIGNITGEGNIAMTGIGTRFYVVVTAAGRPLCGGAATVHVIFRLISTPIGTLSVPVIFVDAGCRIDVPASINLPIIVKGEPLPLIELTSNPVGNGTLTLIPSNTNVAATAGKIVAADSTKGIVYSIVNASWKPEIVGWSGNISTPKLLTFGNTNEVGQFSGTLKATISCN